MKRTLVALMASVVMLTALAPLAKAADPDFWGIDGSRQNIVAQDVWRQSEDGLVGGDDWGQMRFTDWHMWARWFFGTWFKYNW